MQQLAECPGKRYKIDGYMQPMPGRLKEMGILAGPQCGKGTMGPTPTPMPPVPAVPPVPAES